MHDFGGNNTTSAYSTLSSLQEGTTNCFVDAPDTLADRSGYWVPQLYFNGMPVSFSEPLSVLSVRRSFLCQHATDWT